MSKLVKLLKGVNQAIVQVNSVHAQVDELARRLAQDDYRPVDSVREAEVRARKRGGKPK